VFDRCLKHRDTEVNRPSNVLNSITNGEPANTAIVTEPGGADNLTNKVLLWLLFVG
jgi:hypothetical protein